MSGVSFMVDEAGKKTAVILDLRKYGRLWEDMYDLMLVESRRHEPRRTLEQVRQARIRRRAKTASKSNG
jgi:hypothetical protein